MLEMPPTGRRRQDVQLARHSLYQRRHRQPAGNARHLERILPSAVSYFDGFFVFPTQVLARAKTIRRPRRHDGVQGRDSRSAPTAPSRTSPGSRPTSSGSSSSPADFSTILQAHPTPRRSSMRSRARRFPTFRCFSRGSVRSRSGASSTRTTTSIRSTSTSTTSRSCSYFDPTTGSQDRAGHVGRR